MAKADERHECDQVGNAPRGVSGNRPRAPWEQLQEGLAASRALREALAAADEHENRHYEGFSNTGVLLNHTSSDCSGTAYLFQNAAALANVDIGSNIGVVNGVLYYGDAAAAQSMAMNSTRLLNPDGTPEQPCNSANEFNVFSPAITLDLSTLGFTPPFTIQVSGMK